MVGELHIIIGPMFSSKTSYLINKYYTYRLKYDCILINHNSDTRYSNLRDKSSVITHNNLKESAIMLKTLSSIEKTLYNNCNVLFIDEGNFFTDLKIFVINAVENDNKIVFVTGLNGDYNREKFGQLTDLIPYNNTLTFLTGLCHYCNDMTPSLFTLRLDKSNKNQISVGSSENYVSVCRKHFLMYSHQSNNDI